jgi:hypothetical protein
MVTRMAEVKRGFDEQALGDLHDRMRRRARRAVGSFGLMEDERDPHDNYETPPEAVRMLLDHVALRGRVWDPSCGRGAIVKALIDAGVASHHICATDKYQHTRLPMAASLHFGLDFMEQTAMLDAAQHIIMNPPYDQADQHVRHALTLVPEGGMVCVLLRLTWMAAQKRQDLLKHLWKIIMVGRLKMLPPDVPDQGHGGTVDFCWFVFAPDVFSCTHIVRAKL